MRVAQACALIRAGLLTVVGPATRVEPDHVGGAFALTSPRVDGSRRTVTTLVDAAVKPRVGAYVSAIRERLDGIAPGVPFYVMKSNGGVLSAEEVVHQPITTVLSGPAAGALGSGTAYTTRVTPASASAREHGPVRPAW